jgi:hypothetical protein
MKNPVEFMVEVQIRILLIAVGLLAPSHRYSMIEGEEAC